jgi:glycosyltransferase involved in cell wall biosynthesis
MIVGISKCYNEEKIAQETLDHYAQWCDKMVIYDDCSTDSTKDILRKSDKVILIEGTVRGENRREEDYNNRQKALDKARELNTDWYLIFDFDERIEQFPEIEEYSESFSMRLFDAYITEGDKDKDYKSREWF